jgi:hypothetical protein
MEKYSIEDLRMLASAAGDAVKKYALTGDKEAMKKSNKLLNGYREQIYDYEVKHLHGIHINMFGVNNCYGD